MRSLRKFWPRLATVSGAALAAYGGYGAGIGYAVGGTSWHWLQVLLAGGAAAGFTGLGLWKGRSSPAQASASFAADLAALERLVPKVRKHPEGLTALQDLVEILFEACHRPESISKRETLIEREGRRDV